MERPSQLPGSSVWLTRTINDWLISTQEFILYTGRMAFIWIGHVECGRWYCGSGARGISACLKQYQAPTFYKKTIMVTRLTFVSARARFRMYMLPGLLRISVLLKKAIIVIRLPPPVMTMFSHIRKNMTGWRLPPSSNDSSNGVVLGIIDVKFMFDLLF